MTYRKRPREYHLGSYLKACDRCGMLRWIEDLIAQYGWFLCPECLDKETEHPKGNF